LLKWKKIADSFISISVGKEYDAEPITGLLSTITMVSLLIVAVLIQLKKLKFIEETMLSVRRALRLFFWLIIMKTIAAERVFSKKIQC
jgi:hypothetical protein